MPPPKKTPDITPELLLRAYASGLFPMAESRESDDIFWVEPECRGILPLHGFHISRSLARAIRRADYEVRINTDFKAVLSGCAERPETWINARILDLYLDLHDMGYAHSIEIHRENRLVGGVYGVALGAAFFGESMFSRRKDASKIALAYLVDRLRAGAFTLFDTQFITDHLRTLGGVEISREAYHERLRAALGRSGDFLAQPPFDVSASGILQRNTQTS
ncbi:MAG: leucyl/phenylalanyl-tRNA--protein transferase [Paracoccaceae bacterium]